MFVFWRGWVVFWRVGGGCGVKRWVWFSFGHLFCLAVAGFGWRRVGLLLAFLLLYYFGFTLHLCDKGFAVTMELKM